MFNLHRSTMLVLASGFIVCAVLFATAYPALAQTSSRLGTAESFAVLAYSTVTNSGATTVVGNLGVSPGSAIEGFTGPPDGLVVGETHAADDVAAQAQLDVTAAYTALANEPCTIPANDLTGVDLGGMTLVPGVYCFSSSAQLTGTLTLDAGDDPDAEFIFQVGSTLTTDSNSTVIMVGGSPCNVYWQLGASAVIGTGTTFIGNILAYANISLGTGASLHGRALARTEAVTMLTNNVTIAGCADTSDEETPTATPVTPTATPVTPTATPVTPTATPVTPTATPVTPAPATSTPVTQIPATVAPEGPDVNVPGEETAIPEVPGPSGPGSESPAPETATPVAPGSENPDVTATPTLPLEVTVTPTEEVPATSTAVSQVTETPATQTATAQATNAPESTATPVTNVKFPSTGSGGPLATQDSQSVAFANLAAGLAIVALLTAGAGVVVERRFRR